MLVSLLGLPLQQGDQRFWREEVAESLLSRWLFASATRCVRVTLLSIYAWSIEYTKQASTLFTASFIPTSILPRRLEGEHDHKL